MLKRIPLLFLLSLLFVEGCGDLQARMKERQLDSEAARIAIKADLGLDTQISFRSFRGSSGDKLAVAIRVVGTPSGDVATLKASIEKVVRAKFRVPVTDLVVSF